MTFKTSQATVVLCAVAGLGMGLGNTASAAQRAQIEALYSTTISSEVSGRIDKIGYREGESFNKGATLVSIDCTSYAAERDRVAAKLASAQAKRDNQEKLAQLQSAGKLEVDLARLGVNESAAELRAARANVARCSINAPFAGRVNGLEASLGQSIKPQDKLMTVVGQELNARVIVPANWLSWLKKDDAVNLSVSETGTPVTAHVVRIGAAVDPVSHTIPIWARLDKTADLRPGMTARAEFPGAPDNAGSKKKQPDSTPKPDASAS